MDDRNLNDANEIIEEQEKAKAPPLTDKERITIRDNNRADEHDRFERSIQQSRWQVF